MFSLLTVASATGTMVRSARHWIYTLGALGFIPLGLLDNFRYPATWEHGCFDDLPVRAQGTWRPRRDLNPQPLVPKTNALSS